MVKKTILVFALILFLVMPVIIAYRTEVTIKTEPNMLVSISVADPATGNELFSSFERANAQGIYEKSISTAIKEIDIFIVSKDNQNVIIGQQDIMGHTAGDPINLNFVSSEEETEEATGNETGVGNENQEEIIIEEQESIEETESKTEESVKEKGAGGGALSGLTIFGEEGIFSKTTYYIIGIVFIVGILVFFIARRVMKGGIPSAQNIIVRKQSELESGVSNREIHAAEKKIREAQEELNRLKNQEKIREAERKLEEDKKELERLKKGE